ncbi:MAG: glucose-6-phosphate isomerase [Gemmatimonadaceae bacterium]|nr:glucose-6-phosphate isomerase [Gemmatimonadaceae bacterium]
MNLDYTNMLAPTVAGGVDAEAWSASTAAFAAAHAHVASEHARGVLGFLDLPEDDRLQRQVLDAAAEIHGRSGTKRVTDVVVLGIGGSALGPIALRTALAAPRWNELDDAQRGGRPRLHVLDNVDPASVTALLGRLAPASTVFIVTSKSGGTAETMAQYLVVRGWLEQALGDAAPRQLIFVTDPEKGALRALARRESVTALEIPANVGGRFSVLTAVGMLPAAMMGIDTHALLAGAAAMRDRCATDDLVRNPAGVFATLQWLADTRHQRPIHVLMPYSDALRDLAGWFVQLWAESLGKHRAPGDPGFGPTPIPALGATDQHSQVQLFMEGPGDKTVTFIAVAAPTGDVEIPALHGDVPELGYLGGHRLGELLDIERQATAGALARRGRPNMTVQVDRVDANALGQLFMFFELATVYAGALYGVDPMNQPGVELGKQFTYAMLGRADAEQARQEWNLLPKPQANRMV